MARSDLLLKLVKSAGSGDQEGVRRVVEAIIAEERAKQHLVLAEQLESLNLFGRNGHSGKASTNGGISDEKVRDLLIAVIPKRRFADLLLQPEVDRACKELVEEQHRGELLRSHGLEPRHRLLLCGPPGNGKTSIAEALAEALAVPLFCVRYEGLIGSFLGETAGRLRLIFDHARCTPCILFFDEFDTVGKERGDTHETGEIKRVVSSLLLQIDALPSYVVVVCASNHAELLDRAVWRRFQLRLNLSPPSQEQLAEFFLRFQTRVDKPLGYTPAMLAENLAGLSFAEAEEFCGDVYRRYILSHWQGCLEQIVKERLLQWKFRAVPLATR
jgi:SpoVK/Ycf46/Vps4 family AAA+-type ATPase